MASESGIGLSVPVSSKENDKGITNGGAGNVYDDWGSKAVFGKGFMVCFPSPEFSTPFVFL